MVWILDKLVVLKGGKNESLICEEIYLYKEDFDFKFNIWEIIQTSLFNLFYIIYKLICFYLYFYVINFHICLDMFFGFNVFNENILWIILNWITMFEIIMYYYILYSYFLSKYNDKTLLI